MPYWLQVSSPIQARNWIIKKIKIIHNNVCSLLPKLDLIEHEFLDYDVICISESHLDKSIDNDKIKLKGFQNPVKTR